MASLEEIQAKFDFVQKTLDEGYYDFTDSTWLVHFGGLLWQYCECDENFGAWYTKIEPTLQQFNRILNRKGVSELTEEELKTLYEHTKNNIRKKRKAFPAGLEPTTP